MMARVALLAHAREKLRDTAMASLRDYRDGSLHAGAVKRRPLIATVCIQFLDLICDGFAVTGLIVSKA
jgi:hypothetical protein